MLSGWSSEFPLPHEPVHLTASNNKQAIEDIIYGIALEAAAENPRLLVQRVSLITERAYVNRHVTCNKQTVNSPRGVADRVTQSHYM